MVDLEECGFIEKYVPFHLEAESRTTRYAVADPFLRFYGRFIKPKNKQIAEGKFIKSPLFALPGSQYRQWLGYSFESWCRRNSHLVAQALGFSDVNYRSGSYFQRGTSADPGYQIDLVFSRDDRVITVCEIKDGETLAAKKLSAEFDNKLKFLPVPKRATVQRVLI